MSKSRQLDEAWIRRCLTAFCNAAGLVARPTVPQDPDLLATYLNNDADFNKIGEKVADTKVAIARAGRLGSASRGKTAALNDTLLNLLAERQQMIANATKQSKFLEFAAAEKCRFEGLLAEWELNRSLARSANDILKRERIPTISWSDRLDPLPAAVIELVQRHAAADPPVGKLVLMGQEPLPASPLFEFKSAAATGLAKMFSGSVRLAVAVERDRGRNAEVQGAMLARDHLIMPLTPERRPVDERHWRVFDDILPFGARQIIRPRMPYAIPNSAIYSNLRLLLSRDSWRSVRDSAIDRHNGVCVMCGNGASGEVSAEWAFHEPLPESEAFGIQRLIDVKPYCSSCRGVFFPEIPFLKVKAGPIGSFKPSEGAMIVNATMRRVSVINRWETEGGRDPLVEVVDQVIEAYRRRSQIRWALDLTPLNDINISLNPEMVMHPRGWIMRTVDVPVYEAGQPVHLTRIFGCNFQNSDGLPYFFPVPDIHEVEWGTRMEAVWLKEEDQSSVPPAPSDASSFFASDEPAGPLNPDEEDFMVEEGPPAGVTF